MSFRRLPFQFSTTDPVERQRELERRFGLPSSKSMYVDVSNPLSAGVVQKETSSPRLQHRVPIFAEGYDQPIHSSVDSMGFASESKKPKVRVIPIEIEGVESRPMARHRTFSGPPRINKEHDECSMQEKGDSSPVKHSMEDLTKPSKIKPTTGPRVHNIPVQIEGANNLAKSPKIDKVKSKKEYPVVNGCSVSKSFNKVQSPDKVQKAQPEDKDQKDDQEEIEIENSLKKIEHVLEEFKAYEGGVQEFSGTSKDKQYRYLDEMLTRCMLRLDDIDTMGNENVRSARKNAVKKIQASIDLLESKANAVSEVSITSAAESKTKSSGMPRTNKSSDAESEPHNQLTNGIEGNNVDVQGNQIIHHKALDSRTPGSEVKSLMEETSKKTIEGSNDKSEPQNQVTDNIEGNDVEMGENQESQTETKSKQEINAELTKVGLTLPPQNTVANSDNVEMAKNPVGCQVENEMIEVDMTEIKVASSKDLSLENEVNEVEMTDNCNIDHSESKSDLIENAQEATSVQASSNIESQDIEMKDIQSTLDDVTESAVLSNSPESISSQSEKQHIGNSTTSQSEEQDKSVLNMEAKISTNDVTEKTLSTEISDCS